MDDNSEYYFSAKVNRQNFATDDMEELINYAILAIWKLHRERLGAKDAGHTK
jgi:hypothetical protein